MEGERREEKNPVCNGVWCVVERYYIDVFYFCVVCVPDSAQRRPLVPVVLNRLLSPRYSNFKPHLYFWDVTIYTRKALFAMAGEFVSKRRRGEDDTTYT